MKPDSTEMLVVFLMIVVALLFMFLPGFILGLGGYTNEQEILEDDEEQNGLE